MNKKLSLLFLLKSISEKIFRFHGSLDIPQYLIRKMLEFYREILLNWSKFLSYDPSTTLTILSQYLWFRNHINIGNNSVYFSHFLNHGINFIGNLLDINGKYKSWDTIKYEYNLTDNEKFRWLQLVHATPKLWVEALNQDLGLSVSLAINYYSLIKN